ncbi:MAG TPA: RNA polymerase sigma factor SigJ [Gammaproteobacteria bacterium]
MDRHTRTFDRHRARLYGIAYRMLGSHADAEDMLQDTYLRWHRVEPERVRVPEAWLTTTVTRLCIDRLRAAKTEREAYPGPWLPEPIDGALAAPADHDAELASDLSVAFLVVLERLAPAERAAFLLHDVFESDYAEIAGILGKSEASCRQIVHRARERVRRDRPRFAVSEAARQRLLGRFVDAMRNADKDAFLELFAEDATWTSDGGGKVAAASKAVTGNARIAKLLHGVARALIRAHGEDIDFRLAPINGETGIVIDIGGHPFGAITLDVDGRRVLAGYNVLNPEKLGAIFSSAPRT